MKDIGLDKCLMGFIGIPGLTACVLAWVQPMEFSERIVTTAVGAMGLTWSLMRGLSLRSIPARASLRTEKIEA